MSVFAKFNALIIMNYWIFSHVYFAAGEQPSCTADEPPDVGYLRDMCVELARKIYKTLRPKVETTSCDKLVNRDVMNKALEMMKDFNEVVVTKASIPDINDQGFIVGCIDDAIPPLIDSGAAKKDSDIINLIEEFKQKFCSAYLNQASEAEARRLNEEENGGELAGVSDSGVNSIPIDSGNGLDIPPEDNAGVIRMDSRITRDDSFARHAQQDEEDTANDGVIASLLQGEETPESIARRRETRERLVSDGQMANDVAAQLQAEVIQESEDRQRIAAERSANDGRIAREMDEQMRNGSTHESNVPQPAVERRPNLDRPDIAAPGRAAIERAERAARAAAERANQGVAPVVGQRQSTGTTGSQPTVTASQGQQFDVRRWTVADPEDGDPFDNELRKPYPVIAFFYTAAVPNDPDCQEMKSNIQRIIHEKNGKVYMVTGAIETVTMTCGLNEIVHAPYTMICLMGIKKCSFEGVESVDKIREELHKVMIEAGQTP